MSTGHVVIKTQTIANKKSYNSLIRQVTPMSKLLTVS